MVVVYHNKSLDKAILCSLLSFPLIVDTYVGGSFVVVGRWYRWRLVGARWYPLNVLGPGADAVF